MVKKVVIIALVLIIATPILLGYGFNLSQTTVTEYKEDNSQLNVTPLLTNGTGNTYTHGDTYQLNTKFTIQGTETPTMPQYESLSTKKSTFFMHRYVYAAGAMPNTINNIQNYRCIYKVIADQSPTGWVGMRISYLDENNVLQTGTTVDRLMDLYYDDSTKTIYYSYDDLSWGGTYLNGSYTNTGINQLTFYHSGTVGQIQVIDYWTYKYSSNDSVNVDFSAGFHFVGDTNRGWSCNLPSFSQNALITLNLDSITSANYSCRMILSSGNSPLNLRLDKTTTNGVVSWSVTTVTGSPTITKQLYYDPSRNDNTYQVLFSIEKTSEDASWKTYHSKAEFNYVGGWPTVIGSANYYQTYTIEQDKTYSASTPDIGLGDITFVANTGSRTPTIRIDDAYFRAFEYPIIENNQLNAARFKDNPITTISDVYKFGTAIGFAGNVYNVDKSGNITLGTHSVSVNNIKFESVPVDAGYENKINGNTISVTSEPSIVRFIGKWSASVTVDSQSVNTYNHSEWHAGEFAWDGIDTNFLIVGLTTSLAVFIGLGIYARKSNSKGVIPLMIVCGGAAALFFVML